MPELKIMLTDEEHMKLKVLCAQRQLTLKVALKLAVEEWVKKESKIKRDAP